MRFCMHACVQPPCVEGGEGSLNNQGKSWWWPGSPSNILFNLPLQAIIVQFLRSNILLKDLSQTVLHDNAWHTQHLITHFYFELQWWFGCLLLFSGLLEWWKQEWLCFAASFIECVSNLISVCISSRRPYVHTHTHIHTCQQSIKQVRHHQDLLSYCISFQLFLLCWHQHTPAGWAVWIYLIMHA
jgi:hypothetical protein